MAAEITVVLGGGVQWDSHEFIVTYPDGTRDTIWSPVWNQLTPDEELAGATRAAQAFWEHRAEPGFRYFN
jgi:hypothetical protein